MDERAESCLRGVTSEGTRRNRRTGHLEERRYAESDWGLVVNRHRLNGYLAQGVPSLFLASSFTTCLNREVLQGMFPWRTRYPVSRCRSWSMSRSRSPEGSAKILHIYIYIYSYIYIYIHILHIYIIYIYIYIYMSGSPDMRQEPKYISLSL